MALSDNDDLVQRGRAIFERLRESQEPRTEADEPLPEDVSGGMAGDEPPLPEEAGDARAPIEAQEGAHSPAAGAGDSPSTLPGEEVPEGAAQAPTASDSADNDGPSSTDTPPAPAGTGDSPGILPGEQVPEGAAQAPTASDSADADRPSSTDTPPAPAAAGGDESAGGGARPEPDSVETGDSHAASHDSAASDAPAQHGGQTAVGLDAEAQPHNEVGGGANAQPESGAGAAVSDERLLDSGPASDAQAGAPVSTGSGDSGTAERSQGDGPVPDDAQPGAATGAAASSGESTQPADSHSGAATAAGSAAQSDEMPGDAQPSASDGSVGPSTADPPLDDTTTPASVTTVVADAAAVLDSSVDADATPPQPASPLVRPLPRVLAIANQKGGVGKTTTAVNLGAALAELGYRVLVIDLDPQGNATTGLGINPRNLETSVYDVIMHDTPLEDCIEPTSLRNLFVVPATIDLAGAEIELVPAFSREMKLRRALDEVAGEFDYTLIDCPPSLGLITVNGLAAATEVVVPIQCEYYALEGLGQLLRNVSLVQGNLNPKLEVSAIILTMFDARTKLADQVAGEVRAHFGDKVCRNIVPRTVRLSEAPSFGQPIIVFDPSSRGAIAYRELAKEVSGGAPQRVG